MIAFVIELIILIAAFTFACVWKCRDVDAHLDDMLMNYPPAVVKRLIEMGKAEIPEPVPLSGRIRKKLPIAILFVLILSAVVYFVNGCRTFLSASGTCMLIWTIVDWYDALILDCLWFCHSQKVRAAGTEDMDKEYKDYLYHIKGSAVGMLIGLAVSLLVGIVVTLMSLIF